MLHTRQIPVIELQIYTAEHCKKNEFWTEIFIFLSEAYKCWNYGMQVFWVISSRKQVITKFSKFLIYIQDWEFAHRFFERIARGFCKRKSDSLMKMSKSFPSLLSWATWATRSWLLFCKEWRERFTHGCSFVKSDSLLGIKRGKTVNHSLSL